MRAVPTSGPRPKLSWSDLAGARAGIWGLGREGHANLRKLLALGVEPVLVDDRPAGPTLPIPGGRPVLATADGGLAALQRCDVVVKTPGLSRYRPEVAQLSAEELGKGSSPPGFQAPDLAEPAGETLLPRMPLPAHLRDRERR